MTEKTLTAETLTELARPFTAAAIKFKPQTVTQDKSKGLASFYIDARLVAERLNEVVGPENWEDEYRLLADGGQMPALYYPIECRLTVCGVTKTDVGQGANTVLDDKAWKSAYSDALKRAAVKFRIGAYLYNLPNLWAPVKVGSNGKAQGFSPEGIEQLRGQYARWLKSDANTYGAPLDHGDVERPPVEASGAAGANDKRDGASVERGSKPAAPEEPADIAIWQDCDKITAEIYKLVDGEPVRAAVKANREKHADAPEQHRDWLRSQLQKAKDAPKFPIPEKAREKAA